jgi:hypothetical protein
MKNFLKNKIIFLLFLIACVSCASYKKWYQKGTEKGWLVKDTTTYDTIYTTRKGDSFDSTFIFEKDTMFFYSKDSSIVTKYFYNFENKNNYIKTIQKDGVEKTIQKTVWRTLQKPKTFKDYYLFILFLLLIIYLIYKEFKTRN